MGVIDVIKKHERLAGIQQGRQEGVEQGRQQGVEQARTEVVESLISELNLSDEQAARIARVSIDFVRKVRVELSKKG